MKHAEQYEPCGPGEALGWLTVVGRWRLFYTRVRPSRSGWYFACWQKKQPPSFRNEQRYRRVIHIPGE